MSSAKATLMKQQLDEWASAQAEIHRKEKEKIADVRKMDAETSLSRNPFRRQQQQGVTNSSRPLILISAVKVPILTAQVRRAVLAREEKGGGLNLKRKRVETKEQEEETDLMVKSAGVKQKNVTTSSPGGFNWKGWSKNV